MDRSQIISAGAILPALGFLSILGGCDADCDDPTRLESRYSVFSNVTDDSWTLTGMEGADDAERRALLESLFVNGWSEWIFEYVPGDGSFQVYIDGHPYPAEYQQSADNCNAFSLGISGTYTTEIDTAHDFIWNGSMAYFGSHLGGSFIYRDDWTSLDRSGSTKISAAELRATQRSAGDTGPVE